MTNNHTRRLKQKEKVKEFKREAREKAEREREEAERGEARGEGEEEVREKVVEEKRGEKRRDTMREPRRVARSGVGATAAEGAVAVVGGGPEDPRPERKILVPHRHKRDGVAAPPLPEASVNQGVPGSDQEDPMREDLEAGQRQQDDADEIWSDPRVVRLREDFESQNAQLREDLEKKGRDLTEANLQLGQKEAQLGRLDRQAKEAEQQYEASQWENEQLARASDQATAAKDNAIQRADVSQNVIKQLQSDVALLDTNLKDATEAKHQLEAKSDESEVFINGLQQRVDDLEREAAAYQDLATENAALKEQIAETNTTFENVFSDMAKGLTINEKFAYVREHQKADPTGRQRIASGASLEDELDHLSNAGSEHEGLPPKQTLTFSGITAVETTPIATPKPPAQEFTMSKITNVETTPIATPKPPAQEFSMSKITNVETAPIASTARTGTKPILTSTYADKGISTTSPSAMVDKSTSTMPTDETFHFSGISGIEQRPIPLRKPNPAAKPVPVKRETYTRYIKTPVDRPYAYTPWWIWVIFSLALLACFGGFAALLRERQIWIDANSMAYQRLMGGPQETWIEWIGLGVESLLPDLGPIIGLGHSLYG